MTSHRTEFQTAVDRFLEPIFEFIERTQPECTVLWMDPSDPEDCDVFTLSHGELKHQLLASINQGYFVTARGERIDSAYRLSVAIWEEWEGTFTTPCWAPMAGEPAFQQIWSGFASN